MNYKRVTEATADLVLKMAEDKNKGRVHCHFCDVPSGDIPGQDFIHRAYCPLARLRKAMEEK